MASKARQIRLLPSEIENLAALVEWQIIREQQNRSTMFESLRWAVVRAKTQGRRLERSDFDPRLPNPEQDYKSAVEAWEGNRQYVRDLVKEIRDSRVTEQELRHLNEKLWYYDD